LGKFLIANNHPCSKNSIHGAQNIVVASSSPNVSSLLVHKLKKKNNRIEICNGMGFVMAFGGGFLKRERWVMQEEKFGPKKL
jgi:hypothetical protein